MIDCVNSLLGEPAEYEREDDQAHALLEVRMLANSVSG
jgi:hypothetical protein